jgi:hypothetical protein
VCPGGLGVEKLTGHALKSEGHLESESLVRPGLGLVNRTIEDGVNAGAGGLDAHALALAGASSGPASVDQEDVRAMGLELLLEQVGILQAKTDIAVTTTSK